MEYIEGAEYIIINPRFDGIVREKFIGKRMFKNKVELWFMNSGGEESYLFESSLVKDKLEDRWNVVRYTRAKWLVWCL